MKRFAFAIALTLILVGSTYAQGGSNHAGPGELWGGVSYLEKMSGLETAKGTEDFEDDIIWGRSISFAGETGEFTANINRSGVLANIEGGNKIYGGTWTLHVYKGGQMLGMLFGEFSGGLVEWVTDKNGNLVAESLNGTLIITGGTGFYESVGGPETWGMVTSEATINPKGRSVHTGAVSLYFWN